MKYVEIERKTRVDSPSIVISKNQVSASRLFNITNRFMTIDEAVKYFETSRWRIPKNWDDIRHSYISVYTNTPVGGMKVNFSRWLEVAFLFMISSMKDMSPPYSLDDFEIWFSRLSKKLNIKQQTVQDMWHHLHYMSSDELLFFDRTMILILPIVLKKLN